MIYLKFSDIIFFVIKFSINNSIFLLRFLLNLLEYLGNFLVI